MNQVLFSKKCIETYDPQWVPKSQLLPFRISRNDESTIAGCQLVLQKNENTIQFINMISHVHQNLFTHQSKILRFGQKKFVMNVNDYEEYIMVASAMLQPNIINDESKKFTLNETRILIRKC
jgi:hypothetical protein